MLQDKVRLQTIRIWRERWKQEPRSSWTTRLVTHLDKWIDRGHGEDSYNLTRFISGHGYFRASLIKMGKVED